MVLVDDLISSASSTPTDIRSRIKLMVLKARIYDRAGIAQKGFSIAIRAASLAHKSRIMDVLWEALGALCRVLISLSEYDASIQLMRSIMPQVLEMEDCELAATSFSIIADAHMGLAGDAAKQKGASSTRKKEQMTRALGYLGRAFDEFSRLGDVKGECEMMAKRAAILNVMGERVLANDYASKYLAIRKAAEEEKGV